MYTHTVTVAEAKAHLSQILSFVEAGEEVIITKRGRAVAHIEAIKKKTVVPPRLHSFREKMAPVKLNSAKAIRMMREEGYY